MPFTSYAELKAAVIKFNRRNDTVDFLDDAIDLAEIRMSHDMHTWSGEVSAAVPYSSGDIAVTLPDNVLTIYSATVSGATIPEIEIITPKARAQLIALPDGYIGHRASLEEGKLKFVKPFSASGTISLLYKAQVSGLSNTNTSNWLLLRHPNLYMYATLLELAVIEQSDAKINRWKGFYDVALSVANTQQLYEGAAAFAYVDGAR